MLFPAEPFRLPPNPPCPYLACLSPPTQPAGRGTPDPWSWKLPPSHLCLSVYPDPPLFLSKYPLPTRTAGWPGWLGLLVTFPPPSRAGGARARPLPLACKNLSQALNQRNERSSQKPRIGWKGSVCVCAGQLRETPCEGLPAAHCMLRAPDQRKGRDRERETDREERGEGRDMEERTGLSKQVKGWRGEPVPPPRSSPPRLPLLLHPESVGLRHRPLPGPGGRDIASHRGFGLQMGARRECSTPATMLGKQ